MLPSLYLSIFEKRVGNILFNITLLPFCTCATVFVCVGSRIWIHLYLSVSAIKSKIILPLLLDIKLPVQFAAKRCLLAWRLIWDLCGYMNQH